MRYLWMGLVAAIGCGGSLPARDAGEGGDGSIDDRMDGGGPDARSPAPDAAGASALSGLVTEQESGAPIQGARVTLTTPAGVYLDEVRSDPAGRYRFEGFADGDYRVGASSLGREFREEEVTVDGDTERSLALGVERHLGRWSIIGDTEPERPAGTPSATLLPDGRLMFCHDTQDAVLFDPRSGVKSMAAFSPSSQGCHMQTVLSDGTVIFVGGQAREEPAAFTEAVRTVKRYDPATDRWEVLPEMNEERWYPTLVRLPDERLLACGGGQRPDASRTATCEIFDPATRAWVRTGSMALPTEYSPSALLLDGDILTTWWPPQRFDLESGTWRATGEMVQRDRGFPDHSDHTLILLEDGTALAVGYEGAVGSMTELYDPVAETWELRASPEVIRSQAEVVLLPDGRVLVAGGTYESGPATPNAFGEVPNADLYDPARDRWRSVAPMAMAREYHAMTLLVPDGRVVVTSGTGDQARGPALDASVEAFEPPYLFRGPRPVIEDVSTTTLARGGPLEVRFSQTRAPTSLVLMGTGAVTHWVDAGVSRVLRLRPEVEAGSARVTLPATAVELPAGYYLLFVMVDDIPSEGRIVRVQR